jgi:hypothetical protein
MNHPYDKNDIVHITGIDHPESIGIGPHGEVYTTGTGCQVYRVDLATNTAEVFAHTPQRCLGRWWMRMAISMPPTPVAARY